MNVENIHKAIAIMRRAGKVDMQWFQDGITCFTEEDMHTCGTAACFAGWVAVSPEFKADGGVVLGGGTPLFGGKTESDAIAAWLGISDKLASNLVYPNMEVYPILKKTYGEWGSIKAEHVIDALERILSGELQ